MFTFGVLTQSSVAHLASVLPASELSLFVVDNVMQCRQVLLVRGARRPYAPHNTALRLPCD